MIDDVGHASAIAGLKKLMKQPITAHDPSDHTQHLLDESDRSSMILHAALVEEVLVDRIKALMPNLNSDEQNELFNFEGPIGSFSNRIRLAHALNVIDRPTKRKILIIKEIRNVSAHCHSRISFKVPEITAAVASLFGLAADGLDDWSNNDIRTLYTLACTTLSYVTVHDDLDFRWDNLLANAIEQRAERDRSSPEKS